MSESSRSESNFNRESNHRQGGFNKRNDRNSSYNRDRGTKNFGERKFSDRNRNENGYSRDNREDGFRKGRGFANDRGGYRGRDDRADNRRSDRRDVRGFGGDRRENRGGFGGRYQDERQTGGYQSDRKNYSSSDRRNTEDRPRYNKDRKGYSEDRGGFGGYRGRDDRADNRRSDRRDDRNFNRGQDDRGGFGGRRQDDRGNQRSGGYRQQNNADRHRRFEDRDNKGGGNFNRRDDRRGAERDFNNNESRFSDNHQRGGQQRRNARDSAAPNAGYRPSKGVGPELDTDVTGRELDGSVLRQLRALEKDNAEAVGKHLVMAGRYLDIDPQFALEHAKAATRRAGRIAAVREAAGIAAYVAEDFELALRELRTHRRISGSDEHLAVLIDTERALGHVEKALDLAEESKQLELKPAERVEIAIVVSGIKYDQGDLQGAIAALEIPELNSQRGFEYSPRLFEAYGALLEEDGREKEATRWYRLAVVTEAALGQGDFEEPEIFDIFGEPELLEDDEEPSVSIADIEFKAEEAESEASSESEEAPEDYQQEKTEEADAVQTRISDEQAEEENLQEMTSAEESEESDFHETCED